MENAVLTAIVAAIATVLVGLAGPFLGRRWGLPGLGREVQAQQASLISTLQGEVAELRVQRDEDARAITSLRTELASTQKRLRTAEAELLDLYREVGRAPLRQRRTSSGRD